MLKFSTWSVSRRIRALITMEEYIAKHASYEGKYYWENHGYVKCDLQEEMEKIREKIAEDDTMFTNALFSFYIALTTDTSWMNGAAKALTKR